MTRFDALTMLKAGHKLTHKYFTNEEYIYLKKRTIKTEDNVNFSDRFLTDDLFAAGWTIFEG